MIQRERLGIQQAVEHTQYVVVMPVLIAMPSSFAVVRFVGLETNNQALYITGGVFDFSAGDEAVGSSEGAWKRLGQ